MNNKHVEFITTINKPINEVFEFFSKAENLNAITPPDLEFKILTPLPVKMFVGSKIKYRIKIGGIPLLWKTNISEWNPPYKFADEQVSGPYAIWHHQHIFEEKNGVTLMKDIITYKSKGWIFAPILHWLFVDKRVKEIFSYRETILTQIYGS